MSVLTVVQSKSSNDYDSVDTNYKTHTFASPCAIGNSVVLIITALNTELPFAIEPEVGVGTFYPMLQIASDTSTAGMTRYLYKLDNITNAATTIRYKIKAGSGASQQASDAWEIGNTGGSALTLRVDQKSSKSLATSFSENFTAVSANEAVFVHLRMSLSNPTVAATAPFSIVTPRGNSGIDCLYDADMGASGSKTVAWTTVSAVTAAVWIVSFSNTSTTPTVTSVTGNTVMEGGSTVYTVALSGATSATANYPASFGVGTATAADYDSNLSHTGGHATYSNGVTWDGTNMVVPSGVSGWAVTVPTVQDLLDEDNEVPVLIVGGVSSTGAVITDDDALPALIVVNSVSVDAGDSVVITCTVSPVSGRVTQARLVLADGTKVGGVDYTNVITDGMFTTVSGSGTVTISAGVLSIPAGVVSFTITIPTIP